MKLAIMETKKMEKKHTHWFLDISIAILIIIVAILIDCLYVNYKSAPADLIGAQFANNKEQILGELKPLDLIDISNKKTVFLPILNFHHIGSAPSQASKITKSYYIEPEQFEKIISSLKTEDYLSIFMTEAVNFLSHKQLPMENVMAITFDDGNEDFYTQAWPILKKYQLKSSVYLMTGVKSENYLTEEQIKELDQSGLVEFGSHTVWHPYLTKIIKEEQLRELIDSKTYLEKLLNKVVPVVCYPFGLYNDDVIDSAQQAGYQAGLTFDQDAWQNPDNLYELKRISVYPELNIIKFLNKLKNEH